MPVNLVTALGPNNPLAMSQRTWSIWETEGSGFLYCVIMK